MKENIVNKILMDAMRSKPSVELLNALIKMGIISEWEREFWMLRIECGNDGKVKLIKALKMKYHPNYLCNVFNMPFEPDKDIVYKDAFPYSLHLAKAKQIADQFYP